MADCKTMFRRKSRDSLFQPNPGLGCGCGGQSYANSTRSKSYHYHHQLPNHYQYPPYQQPGYQYGYNNMPTNIHYSSTPPLPPLMTPPPPNVMYHPLPPQHMCSSPPPHFGSVPSSLSAGVLECNLRQHHYQNENEPILSNDQYLSQLPPPRPWVQLGYAKNKRTSFTLLCYNILCSRYASKTLYNYCPNWALDWSYRRKAILQELTHYAPDIISLQEMETDQFYNFFLPQLQSMGYSGIFGAKSRARTMNESKRKLVDGCAIFYRTSKFRLLSQHLIEFSQVAIENATWGQCSEDMINRVQTKDNIALVALFETKLDSDQVGGFHNLVAPRPRPLLVSTCHIHWDPNYCDVKLVQTMMLMQELRKITDKLLGPDSETTVDTESWVDKVNLLVCGDFNSLPESGVVSFMQSGTISSVHPDFKGLSYEGYMKHCSCEKSSPRSNDVPVHSTPPDLPEDSSTKFHHEFSLKSVYPSETMPFTNYTLDFQGVIDYIFYSIRGLRPLGLLGPLDSSWLVQNNIVGAPHPSIPSDHLPLLVELEMVPVIG